VAASVLRFLQVSDPETDGAFHAERASTAPAGTAAVIATTEWFALRHPGDRGPLSDLLSLVGDALGEAVKLPPESRARLRGSEGLTRLAAELCGNVGVVPFTLRHGGDGADVRIEPGERPALRVGVAVARRAVPEQRFLLARMAARVRGRSAIAARLGATDLGNLIAAVVRLGSPGYAGTGEPPEGLVAAAGRALPRKLRKAIEERALALAKAGPQDVAAWQAALAATADRVGLLLSIDLAAALSLLLREGGSPGGTAEEVASAVRGRPDLRQLLCFAASEDHLRLRQRLKLAVAS